MQDHNETEFIHCPYKNVCSGCSNLNTAYSAQVKSKKAALLDLLKNQQIGFSGEINFHSIGSSNFRTRSDLILEGKTIGFVKKESQQIADISECPLWIKGLNTYFEKVRHIFQNCEVPIKKGSLRIRCSGHNSGVWLDFSNINVKELFDEKITLIHLLKLGIVEIGQRRKRLVLFGGQLKLRDPAFEAWTETSNGNKNINLLASIASFTQTGPKANFTLVNTLKGHIQELNLSKSNSAIEFGSGVGTFSFLLQNIFDDLTLCESDKESLRALEQSFLINNIPIPKMLAGDFQNKNSAPINTNTDYIFLNPPRSGIKNFLNPLFSQKNFRPKISYLSCYPESMSQDLAKLITLGYRVTKIDIIDQFPHTHHMEVLASLTI